MTIHEFLALLDGVKKSGDGWIARCPSHDDRNPSLSISVGRNGDTVLHCFAGCSPEAVCDAMGISVSDLFADSGSSQRNGRANPEPESKPSNAPVPDFGALTAQYQAALSDVLAQDHADRLGVSVDALRRLQAGWDGAALCFSMRDATGAIIGIRRRFADGRKLSVKGSRNGLFIPDGVDDLTPLFVCEGPTDLAAALTLGLNAIGRSSCTSDVKPVADYCRNHSIGNVVTMTDADDAGRRGAEAMADELAAACESVKVIEPPTPHKDTRDWLRAGATLDDVMQLVHTAEPWKPQPQRKSVARKSPVSSALKKLREVPAWRRFPIEALPAPFNQFVAETAKAIGVDPSMVALPLLAAAAGVVGNARSVMVKRGWFVPCCLWTCVIAESGDGKSPALRAAVKALRRIDSERHEKWAEEFAKYEEDKLNFEVTLKEWKKKKIGEPPGAPTPPICARHIINEATVEAVVSILGDNPRGLVLIRDELSALLRGFNQYKKAGGSDAQHWLGMHDGETLIVDRKTPVRTTTRVKRALVSITGGIQPGIVRRAFTPELRASGLFARMMLAWPPRSERKWVDATVDETLERAVDAVFDALAQISMEAEDDGPPKPGIVKLSSNAKQVFVKYFNEIAKHHATLYGDDAAAVSKLEEGAVRLALVIHLIREAAGDPLINPSVVDAVSMTSGVTLARWFINETLRINALFEQDGDVDFREARQLLEFVRRNGGRITPRELQQRVRRFRDSAHFATEALQQLVDADLGQWVQTAPSESGGRPCVTFLLCEDDVYETPGGDPEIAGFVDNDAKRDSNGDSN